MGRGKVVLTLQSLDVCLGRALLAKGKGCSIFLGWRIGSWGTTKWVESPQRISHHFLHLSRRQFMIAASFNDHGCDAGLLFWAQEAWFGLFGRQVNDPVLMMFGPMPRPEKVLAGSDDFLWTPCICLMACGAG